MAPLGYIVRYYINKYQPSDLEHNILTVDNIKNIDNIDRDSLILSSIFEIYLKKNHSSTKLMTSNKLIYKMLGKIIHEVIDDNFSYNDWLLNFDEVYMINMVTEILTFDNNQSNNTDHIKDNTDHDHIKDNTDHIKDIIISSYFVTKRLIYIIENNDNTILSYMDTIMIHVEDLDITLLTITQIREVMTVMNIKRRLYLRIFLVISNHMIRENSVINSNWVKRKIKIKNMIGFKDALSDDIVELVIAMTGMLLK